MLKIAEVKDPLTHILLQYTTENNLKWDIFKGTGVTSPEDLKTKLTNQATLSKIYDNIVDQFIAFMKPFVGDNGKNSECCLFVNLQLNSIQDLEADTSKANLCRTHDNSYFSIEVGI